MRLFWILITGSLVPFGFLEASEPGPNTLTDQKPTAVGSLPQPVVASTQAAVDVPARHPSLDLARTLWSNMDFAGAEKTITRLLETEKSADVRRDSLLELASLYEASNQLVKAQQAYGRITSEHRDDPVVPEILLRQGLLYRKMGAPSLAISKFYSVISSALAIQAAQLERYQELVLKAQGEIADTYYEQGNYVQAAELYGRLLKLGGSRLDRQQVQLSLIRAWAAASKSSEVIREGGLFLEASPGSGFEPEVRFLIAGAFKQLNRSLEAMDMVLALLRLQRQTGDAHRDDWLLWQQRAGNEVANYLYVQGDIAHSLEIYLRMAELSTAPQWQIPALYQAAVAYERLEQADKATEIYTRIEEAGKNSKAGDQSEVLRLISDMARWRKEQIGWRRQAYSQLQNFRLAAGGSVSGER